MICLVCWWWFVGLFSCFCLFDCCLLICLCWLLVTSAWVNLVDCCWLQCIDSWCLLLFVVVVWFVRLIYFVLVVSYYLCLVIVYCFIVFDCFRLDLLIVWSGCVLLVYYICLVAGLICLCVALFNVVNSVASIFSFIQIYLLFGLACAFTVGYCCVVWFVCGYLCSLIRLWLGALLLGGYLLLCYLVGLEYICRLSLVVFVRICCLTCVFAWLCVCAGWCSIGFDLFCVCLFFAVCGMYRVVCCIG